MKCNPWLDNIQTYMTVSQLWCSVNPEFVRCVQCILGSRKFTAVILLDKIKIYTIINQQNISSYEVIPRYIIMSCLKKNNKWINKNKIKISEISIRQESLKYSSRTQFGEHCYKVIYFMHWVHYTYIYNILPVWYPTYFMILLVQYIIYNYKHRFVTFCIFHI